MLEQSFDFYFFYIIFSNLNLFLLDFFDIDIGFDLFN